MCALVQTRVNETSTTTHTRNTRVRSVHIQGASWAVDHISHLVYPESIRNLSGKFWLSHGSQSLGVQKSRRSQDEPGEAPPGDLA